MIAPLINRDFLLMMDKKTEIIQLLIFFVIINFIFSFSLPNLDEKNNYQLGISIILVSQILAMNLNKRWIFERDYELKILQQIHLSETSILHIITAKIISNFLFFGAPTALFIPISTIFFNLSPEYLPDIMLCTFICAIIISILNVMLSSITIGLRNGGAISIILSMPLLMPVIILHHSFLTSEEMAYSKLLSGSIGLTILYFILAAAIGNIGISSAAED